MQMHVSYEYRAKNKHIAILVFAAIVRSFITGINFYMVTMTRVDYRCKEHRQC